MPGQDTKIILRSFIQRCFKLCGKSKIVLLKKSQKEPIDLTNQYYISTDGINYGTLQATVGELAYRSTEQFSVDAIIIGAVGEFMQDSLTDQIVTA